MFDFLIFFFGRRTFFLMRDCLVDFFFLKKEVCFYGVAEQALAKALV